MPETLLCLNGTWNGSACDSAGRVFWEESIVFSDIWLSEMNDLFDKN
jgi:hypothetical protein